MSQHSSSPSHSTTKAHRIAMGGGLVAPLLLVGCAAEADTPTSESSPATATSCAPMNEQQAQALFDRWNASLATGDPEQVLSNYRTDAVLLPTLSDVPRDTPTELRDYFDHFLKKGPQGTIDFRVLHSTCNAAVDTGTYTFTFADGSTASARFTFAYEFADGQWKIISHHSSLAPLPS